MAALMPKFEAEGIKPRPVRLDGNPGEVIADYAENTPLDLLLMGSHGYGNLRSALMELHRPEDRSQQLRAAAHHPISTIRMTESGRLPIRKTPASHSCVNASTKTRGMTSFDGDHLLGLGFVASFFRDRDAQDAVFVLRLDVFFSHALARRTRGSERRTSVRGERTGPSFRPPASPQRPFQR